MLMVLHTAGELICTNIVTVMPSTCMIAVLLFRGNNAITCVI